MHGEPIDRAQWEAAPPPRPRPFPADLETRVTAVSGRLRRDHATVRVALDHRTVIVTRVHRDAGPENVRDLLRTFLLIWETHKLHPPREFPRPPFPPEDEEMADA